VARIHEAPLLPVSPQKAKTVRLQVAETCVGTRALGPGLRSVAWVQGCPFRCRGCIAPEWIPERAARAMDPADLAAELLSDPGVSGFTFSGGEPMAQAAGLAEVIRIARQQRDVSLICFTGYRLGELRDRPPGPGVAALLTRIDVLIDGRYVAARNDGRGLRGSSNQQVHLLTGRLAHVADELAAGPRRTEIRLRGRSALLVGVPEPQVAEAFERVPGLAGGASRLTTNQ
jgi:anaerobic ribonucleoside-triphosphate reductase activating protein